MHRRLRRRSSRPASSRRAAWPSANGRPAKDVWRAKARGAGAPQAVRQRRRRGPRQRPGWSGCPWPRSVSEGVDNEMKSARDELNFLITNRVPRILLTRLMGWYSGIENPRLTRLSIALWRRFGGLDLAEAKEQRF